MIYLVTIEHEGDNVFEDEVEADSRDEAKAIALARIAAREYLVEVCGPFDEDGNIA